METIVNNSSVKTVLKKQVLLDSDKTNSEIKNMSAMRTYVAYEIELLRWEADKSLLSALLLSFYW